MSVQSKIAVIILNWNGKKDTLECLKTATNSSDRLHRVELIVVDNNSADDSVSSIRQRFPRVILLENSQNLGFSGGNNVGIKYALEHNFDYIILLNNDTTVTPETFTTLVTQARKHNFDIASPKIYFYPGCEFHHDSYTKAEIGKVIWYAGGRIDWPNVIPRHIGVDEVDHGQYNLACETEFATGCCLLIDPKVFKSIGFLDDSYIAYFEDNDFCQRALKVGYKVGYLPQAHMWHKNASSSGGSGSKKQTTLVDSSRFRFAMRYAPLRAKLAIIKQKITKSN